jgi:hypothetical protein
MASANSGTAIPGVSVGAAAKVNKEFVLQKGDFFVDVQLWHFGKLRPDEWLSNFDADEQEHAVHLLNAFMYFSNRLVEQLFCAAFQELSQVIRRNGDSFLAVQGSWRSFVDSLIITRVTGENPSDADSGFQFVRMARDLLQIPEGRILSPADAISVLLKEPPKPIIFVDDFVGSGSQFIHTWHRKTKVSGSEIDFEMLAASRRGATFFYIPLICTETGLQNIQSACQHVSVVPAHLLSSRYSAIADDSFLWPDHLRPTASSFLYRASKRAGISDSQWKGFNDLALTVGFEHSVPDATLPIFYWKGNGWRPLIDKP